MKFLNAVMNIERCVSYTKIGLKFLIDYVYMTFLWLVQLIFNVVDIQYQGHTLFYGYVLYFLFGNFFHFSNDIELDNVTYAFYRNGVIYYKHVKGIQVHNLYNVVKDIKHDFKPVSESMRKCIKVTYMGKNYTKKFTRLNYEDDAIIRDILSCFTKTTTDGRVKVRKINTGAFKGWDSLLGMKSMGLSEPVDQI